MSLTDFGRLIDVDQGLLSKIERGLRPPPEIVPYVQRMAQRFGLKPCSKEYRELFETAYRERFPAAERPPSRLITLGFSDCAPSPARSAGLAGLPLEDTHPDSPAGRYYRSLGYEVGQNWQRRLEGESPPGTPPPDPTSPESLADWDAAKAQAWMFRTLASLGALVTKLEQQQETWRVELRMPDASQYEVEVRRKPSGEQERDSPPGPPVAPETASEP